MRAILYKELRGRMRGWGAPLLLTGYVGFLALITFLVMAVDRSPYEVTGVALSRTGTALFVVLNVLQTGLIMLIAPSLTATAIAGERDRQTFDLLRSTRLSAWEIVAGKLVAGLAFVLLLVVATIPLFSLVFVYGGVSAGVVLRSIAVQVMTALVMGAGGLYFSALARRTAGAMALGIVLAIVLGAGTILIGLWTPPIGAVRWEPGMPLTPGTVFYDVGPVGFTIRGIVEADGSYRPILPAAFHLNPGLAIVSAAALPGMPEPFDDIARDLERAAGVPLWSSYLVLSAVLTLVFLLATWWRLEPGFPDRLRRRLRRERSSGAAA